MFVPTVITKLWDPQAAAAEIYRCAKKGAKALAFPENVTMIHGLPSFWTNHWDPVWRAAEELDMPICMHIGSGFGSQFTTTVAGEQPATVGVTLGVVGAQKALVDFSMSPVARKFEKIKLVFSESGIGWIPSTLERVDRQFKRHAAWTKLTGMLPSEIYARNMYFCTIYEPVSIKTVGHQVGYDKMLWELDYPHADTPWPDAQAEVRECVEGMTDQQRDAVLVSNAERIFNWKAAALPQEYRQAAE
jgi:predicted TIM-barrel fold metal-dependent hydrolase